MKGLRVVLADDHAVLRAGLRLLVDGQPDMTVVAEAADGPEAVRKARQTRPDVVVLDLTMPRTDPVATIRHLSRLGMRTVVLTMHDERAYVDAALAAGAQGYVVKKAADVELLAAIRAVNRGSRFLASTSRARNADTARARPLPRLERARGTGSPAHRLRLHQSGDRRPAPSEHQDGRNIPRPRLREARSALARRPRAVRAAHGTGGGRGRAPPTRSRPMSP